MTAPARDVESIGATVLRGRRHFHARADGLGASGENTRFASGSHPDVEKTRRERRADAEAQVRREGSTCSACQAHEPFPSDGLRCGARMPSTLSAGRPVARSPWCSRGRVVREATGSYRLPGAADHHREPRSTASPLQNVLAHFVGVRRSGDDRWMAHCSHHDDRSASLSIREGADGRILLHCHAGCSTVDVVASAGLSFVDLFPPESSGRQRARVWKGIVPMGPHGRPALDAFGDDTVTAMLAEIGRVAYARNRLDQRALRALSTLAGAAGSTRAAMRDALAVAIAGDIP